MNININIIGLGFVGLTTALGFCEKRFQTVCVEKDKKKLNKIKNGVLPFEEPMLKKILKKNLIKKKIIFSKKPVLFKKKHNVVFICVGTPSRKNGSINLKYIENIIKELNYAVKIEHSHREVEEIINNKYKIEDLLKIDLDKRTALWKLTQKFSRSQMRSILPA